MSNDHDWLVRQARASAVWLAAMPVEVLSPTGRSLRASSSVWLPKLGDTTLRAVPPRKAETRSRKSVRQTRGDSQDSQLPLVSPVTEE